MLMAVMTPPDCLKRPETPKPRSGLIEKYISGNTDQASIFVLIPILPKLQSPFILRRQLRESRFFQNCGIFCFDLY